MMSPAIFCSFSARLALPMHAARVSASLGVGMMNETCGRFLSVASIWSAIASICIDDVPRVFSTQANYKAPRIADKVLFESRSGF